ncbi:hypothetical protein L211DRAFT_848867 [Terfezia boudieri ATCC MYA-4762]|uniref:AMP-activated protein kinase glycogen-binding domain-containing protein n=1 Tax=Terfezia boudieri ATCC MYA-4762 TaxID=1051890 RepID=A0A3N4LNY4_9PEZI|nr:hypothetical protein L211DRAFT_848867 [Terfezia boudieri ATCC MYA-4762]
MGIFEFTWPHQAGEVLVAGTFNEWKGSKLCKDESGLFTALVDLGDVEKVCYKYIVDGHWTVNYDRRREYDNFGNENNVLYPEDWQETPAPSIRETPSQEEPEVWQKTPAPSIKEAPVQEEPEVWQKTPAPSIKETQVQEEPEVKQKTPASSIRESPAQKEPEVWLKSAATSIRETPVPEVPEVWQKTPTPSINETSVEKTVEPENQPPATNTTRCVSPTMSPLTTPAAPTTHVYTVGVPGATFNSISKAEPAPSTRSSSASSQESHNEKRELFRDTTPEKKKRRSVILGRILNLFK